MTARGFCSSSGVFASRRNDTPSNSRALRVYPHGRHDHRRSRARQREAAGQYRPDDGDHATVGGAPRRSPRSDPLHVERPRQVLWLHDRAYDRPTRERLSACERQRDSRGDPSSDRRPHHRRARCVAGVACGCGLSEQAADPSLMSSTSAKIAPTMTRRQSAQRRRPLLPFGGRRRVVQVPREPTIELQGRAAASTVACLRSALRAERQAVEALGASRRDVLGCIAEARRSGVTFSSIAAAITPRGPTIRDTIVARKRAASALACRVHEARKRSRRQG